MSARRSFVSDNNAGAHPEAVAAIARANVGRVGAYGDDPYTADAHEVLRRHLGEEAEICFVYGGTGANVVGLSALLRPFESVVCAAGSHIDADECGAPERHLGSKLLPLPTRCGKLDPETVERGMLGVGDPHHVQPRVLSIAQSTERGTVYRLDELAALAEVARRHDLLFHVDGARLANAAAATGASLAELTREVGVDVLSLGGTKNGMVFGEAVVVFDRARARPLPYLRKQAMQLPSKMRFVAAQFAVLFEGDLWLEGARHANVMAARLSAAVTQLPGIALTCPTEANAVFATGPRRALDRLREEFAFYTWEESLPEVRWMTAFDTRPEEVDEFVDTLRRALSATD